MDEARKKMADALVGKLGGKKDEPEPKEEASGPDAGLVAAMDDFLSAIEAKDSTAMAEAWSNACTFK